MKDLIALLKQNEKPYCKMDEAMQAKADQLSKKCFEWLNANGVWIGLLRDTAFIKNETYRLRADYTPPAEDEYELKQIFIVNDHTYRFHLGLIEPSMTRAADFSNFAGYLYEDGEICASDIRYFDVAGNEVYRVTLRKLNSGEITIFRPTHVVFKRTK